MAKPKPPAEKKPEQPTKPAPPESVGDPRLRAEAALSVKEAARPVMPAEGHTGMAVTEEAEGAVPLTPEMREKLASLDLTRTPPEQLIDGTWWPGSGLHPPEPRTMTSPSEMVLTSAREQIRAQLASEAGIEVAASVIASWTWEEVQSATKWADAIRRRKEGTSFDGDNHEMPEHVRRAVSTSSSPPPTPEDEAKMLAARAQWRVAIATVGHPLREAVVFEGLKSGDVNYVAGAESSPDVASGLEALTEDGKQLLRLLAGKPTTDTGPCGACGQDGEDVSGEYPCPACGRPTVHDSGFMRELAAQGTPVSDEALAAYNAESLRLGRVGFDAYGEHPGPAGKWKTFDGRDIPRWTSLLAGKNDDGTPNRGGALTCERWGVAVRAAISASPEVALLGELLEVLSERVGERGGSEGAVDTLKRVIREGRVDGRAFNLGRSEGRAEVAVVLRRIVDPRDEGHLSLDGALDRVRELNALRSQLAGMRKGGEDSFDALRRLIRDAREHERSGEGVLGALASPKAFGAAFIVTEVKPERYRLAVVSHHDGHTESEVVVEEGPWSQCREERDKLLPTRLTPKAFQE